MKSAGTTTSHLAEISTVGTCEPVRMGQPAALNPAVCHAHCMFFTHRPSGLLQPHRQLHEHTRDACFSHTARLGVNRFSRGTAQVAHATRRDSCTAFKVTHPSRKRTFCTARRPNPDANHAPDATSPTAPPLRAPDPRKIETPCERICKYTNRSYQTILQSNNVQATINPVSPCCGRR